MHYLRIFYGPTSVKRWVFGGKKNLLSRWRRTQLSSKSFLKILPVSKLYFLSLFADGNTHTRFASTSCFRPHSIRSTMFTCVPRKVCTRISSPCVHSSHGITLTS
jgi:hypothetical protein